MNDDSSTTILLTLFGLLSIAVAFLVNNHYDKIEGFVMNFVKKSPKERMKELAYLLGLDKAKFLLDKAKQGAIIDNGLLTLQSNPIARLNKNEVEFFQLVYNVLPVKEPEKGVEESPLQLKQPEIDNVKPVINVNGTTLHWWNLVTECQDKAPPMILIIGNENSGKTTTARAIAKLRSYTGKFIVLDPKGTPDKWGGLNAVGAGAKWESISVVCRELLQELDRRYEEQAQGIYNQEMLTIVVDEFNAIVDECGSVASTLFRRIKTMGREANMCLVALAQSELVKSLGLEGRSDTKEGFAFIYLGKFAQNKGAYGNYPAWLYFPTKNFNSAVDRGFMNQYETLQFNINNWWQNPNERSVIKPPMPENAIISNEKDLIRVAMWLKETPEPSVREIARRLYPQSVSVGGGGSYSKQAEKLIDMVKSVMLDVTCNTVTSVTLSSKGEQNSV